MTAAQRRWKWVKYEHLPPDMQKVIRPPVIKKEKTREQKTKKEDAKDDIVEETITIHDKDIDFTVMANVDMIMNKYKNAQMSRKNYNPEEQIEVFNIILEKQKDQNDLCIEILNLQINTYFSNAKKNSSGYLTRDGWLMTNEKISYLLKNLIIR